MNLRSLSLLCIVTVCVAQSPPSFERDRIFPSYGDRLVSLAPGLLVSIYGNYLGPSTACQGQADTLHRQTPSPLRPQQTFSDTLIYPTSLCDTQVFVSDVPAGLLYVQERQINFQVPQAVAIEGSTEVRVVYRGQSAIVSGLRLGLELAVLSLERPAAVGMPVWLKVSMPEWKESVRYPFDIHPAGFRCQEVEVKRNGTLLPRSATLVSQSINGISGSGNPCGFLGLPAESRHLGRIPLHLQYRFDQPGAYEVRFAMRGVPQMPPIATSDWTAIEILPANPDERKRWLTRIGREAPTGVVDLLTDFLPDILGNPDDQSLQLLLEYLYHSDALVRQFAMYGLTYWPRDQATASVKELMRGRGPCDVCNTFLTGVRVSH